MPFSVYILQCADDTYYVGYAADVQRRVDEHNDGRGSRHSARRRPVRLMYSEQCPSLRACVARERQIKGWSAAKKMALIEGRTADLKQLAKRVRR
jgi:putative endonuclease